ncbi:MAG: trimethylamine methyltransferase family protein [Methanomassiliicoccaceae archaeon]|nr:trimethylamine methyltransferase family protein [Methanomassiliicoccaceae archaeon]
MGENKEDTIAKGLILKLLSDEDIRAIDNATREILSTHGIVWADSEGLDYFEKGGCTVDRATMTVLIPSSVIDSSLKTAPKKFCIYGRGDDRTVTQEQGGRVNFTTYGPCIRVAKYVGYGRYRHMDSTDSDLGEIARLCDWADGVSHFTVPIAANDWINKGSRDVHEIVTSLSNTTKHIQYAEPIEKNMSCYWNLVKAYYRGDEKLARERPILSFVACSVTPLLYGSNASQVIIKCAKLGIPVNILSMAMAGASAPIYLAGVLILQNVEVLAGIVLSQLVSPGARVWYGSSSTAFDLRHGTPSVGTPELGMLSLASNQLGRFYKLPTITAGMLSDSKVLDSQSAHERTLSSSLSSMSGATTVFGLGTLELGLSFSLEQLVIDNEIVNMERSVLRGIEVNTQTMFVDIIKNLGVNDRFLSHSSTVENVDLTSKTKLFDRSTLGDWQRRGSKPIEEMAHEVVVEVLKTHCVEPIAKDIMDEMKKIIHKADAKAIKEREDLYGE